MSTLNEQIARERRELEGYRHQIQVDKRKQEKVQTKEENHWNFLAGELVSQYLKDILDIPVYKGKGASEKNAAAFAPLKNILAFLADNEEFTRCLMAGNSGEQPL